MAKNSRKQNRKLAAENEINKRENALGVPSERQVFAFEQHYCDAGGPRQMKVKQLQRAPHSSSFQEWQQQLQNAGERWVPVEIEPYEDIEVLHTQPVGDFSKCSDLMIFSERAVIALRHLLEPSGLLLPLICETGNYVGFRLDAEVDALDVERTRASWRLPGTDSASSITSYAFHTERLGAHAIFRVPQHFEILVNLEFVNVVRSAGLTGIRFCRVWPSAMVGLWWHGKWC